MLITRKASEGLSFMNVREIHILDPWYHFNRHEQIIGRGFRRCSHIKLPLAHRNLTVFVYCGYFNDSISPDIHAYNIAKTKLKKIKDIINIIEENAFDNKINEKLNRFPRSLFSNVNPIKITSSQGSEIDYYFGDNNKEYTDDVTDVVDNNLRNETMFLSNRYIEMIKEIMKHQDYVSYNTLLEKVKDKRYLDLAITNVIFPNKVGNYLLVFNNDGIQKINDFLHKNIKEIVLDNIKVEVKATNYSTILKNFENKFSEFELFYRFMIYINNKNWDEIATEIINNKSKLYTVLKEYGIIIDDYYFDLFNSDKVLKNIDNKYVDMTNYKFIEQTVKNTELYGDIGIAVKTKGVLDKNLSFKLVTSGNKGTKCESQPGSKLDKILGTKSKSNIIEKCVKIAEQFYKNGNLKIIPYIKMKK